ncbi:his Kinase A domain protein [Clostridioides difficile P64]|nr:histidine kinase dimerization/phospho-acceptor domain-containing protein [Clostridioides difficile]ERM39856.1 his Kinase A domain protein [Clostridioides difficile P64]
MNTSVYLLLILALSLIIIAYLVSVLLRVRVQLTLIKDALEDIKNGNLNRRILTDENDITKQICYDINEIAINSQFQLIQQKQSEQAYKQLMTSLSHDVKTPLASLVGYLEAVESKIVVGEEKDEYIHVASNKAHYLKNFVENLFEWVKLDSKEQVFHFDIFDLKNYPVILYLIGYLF